MRLKIAAKMEEEHFFKTKVEPFLSPDVEFIGEVNDTEKVEFLRGAHALLFPITWLEPFGMVMIEAMACGTPVIAFRFGSVPEVVEHGTTGFVVDSEEEAVEAVRKLHTISRETVRRRFEERFTSKIMAQSYLKIYEKLLINSK